MRRTPLLTCFSNMNTNAFSSRGPISVADRFFRISLLLVTIGAGMLGAAERDYPPARRSEDKDLYFGTEVRDPYRWMETGNTPELTRWIERENSLTDRYLRSIPFRDALRKRLVELVDYPKLSLPWKRAGRLFYFKNDGLQNQAVLYVQDTPESAPRVLLDPNTLSEDGTVSLQATAVSKDGTYLAYSLARSGSDWNEIRVLPIASGEPLPDRLDWVKFSRIAWHGDGFYYSRYDAPPPEKRLTAKNENHKIYYHRLGTDQDEDLLVLDDPEHPRRTCRASTDRDQTYLFVSQSDSTYGNSLRFKRISGQESGWTTIVDDFDSRQDIVAAFEDRLYLLTDRNAPNKRLVRVDPKRPESEHWVDVIPESENLLDVVRCVGGKWIAGYLKDAAHAVFVYDMKGDRLREIELPALGIVSFSGEKDDPDYFQSMTSYLYPAVIDRCDIDRAVREPWHPATLRFDPDAFVTERVWYENNDGKKVPIFLTHKKGLVKNGNNPTLLYGYGGFNINVRPAFSPYRLPFLEQGGIYAHAVLRGGGEYGESWYRSGTLLQKRNVFDDFIAASEFLIREGYTSPDRLAIQGGSNGGLLVAAALTQRPDLYRAAVPAVGVLDMLRYHKFTIGWAWARDYGTAEQSKEMFEYLFGYSPLHNIRSGVEYPAILVTTSDHDDRVVPAHSFKFVAEMQAESTGSRPTLIRIETKAGHGAGKPIGKRIDESTDVWSFLMDQLGMKPTF